jgi:TonB family protein
MNVRARRLLAVLLLLATLAVPALRAAEDEALAVRLALVVGNRGEAPLPDVGEVLSDELMADYLTQWDPHSDNPEIRRLFALRGLSEVTRQAARLQPAGGTVAGAARIGATRWRIEMDVQRSGRHARFAARIYRDDELLSAPTILSELGEKAIVSTSSEGDPAFLFVVVQADDWSAVQARLPLPAGATEPVASHPRVITKVPPVYPPSEREAGRQGIVVLALRVDRQGTVGDARVVKSLGPAFDEAALTAVRQWRFEPVRRDGRAVDSELNITINFVPAAKAAG